MTSQLDFFAPAASRLSQADKGRKALVRDRTQRAAPDDEALANYLESTGNYRVLRRHFQVCSHALSVVGSTDSTRTKARSDDSFNQFFLYSRKIVILCDVNTAKPRKGLEFLSAKLQAL